MIGALRYEWRRISSIRSTWILVGCAIALSVAFAFLFSSLVSSLFTGSDASDMQGLEISLSGNLSASTTNLIVLILLGTLAAQAFGQEYRHGTIRLTLTSFPNRTTVFVAKSLVCCLVILVSFLAANVLAWLVFRGNPYVTDASAADVGGYLVRTGAYILGFCLIIFSITVLTRVLALGVIIPLAVAAVAEPLVAVLLGDRAEWLLKGLPFTAGSEFVSGDAIVRNGAVFGGWVVVLTVAGYIVFARRDA